MIESKKVSQEISDYVLDLLSPADRKQVEEHAAHNPAYKAMLQRERQVEQMVRTTLHETTTPDATRLHQLMPAIPQAKRPFAFFSSGWAQQMVAVAALAIFILGGFSVYQSQQNPVYDSTPTLTAATATFTNEPTATTDDGDEEMAATSTAVAIHPAQQSDITPSPVATPIAALPPVTSN